MTGDLLIVGGYGVVGRRIAALLAPDLPGRVVIAGRRLDVAQSMCSAIGSGARARRMDVDSRESVETALDDVEIVVSCADQREPYLVQACARRGLGYTDITPHLAFRNDIEALDQEARQSGARLLLGAGLAPGIANMMAAWLIRHIGPAEEIHTTVLLSIDDEYGPASAGFLLEKADAAIWHHRRAEQPDRVAVHRAGAGRLPAADRQTIRLPVPLFMSSHIPGRSA